MITRFACKVGRFRIYAQRHFGASFMAQERIKRLDACLVDCRYADSQHIDIPFPLGIQQDPDRARIIHIRPPVRIENDRFRTLCTGDDARCQQHGQSRKFSLHSAKIWFFNSILILFIISNLPSRLCQYVSRRKRVSHFFG